MINIQGTKKAGIPRLFHRCVMLPLLYIVLRARALHVLLRLFHAGGYAALHRRAGDEVVAERREDARDRHRRLEHGPDHAARRRAERAGEERLVRLNPARKAERHEEREADDEHVALAAHVRAHEVLDAERAYRAEERDVRAADDGRRHRRDESAELADEREADKYHRARAHDVAARDAGQADEADVLGVRCGADGAEQARERAAHALRADAAVYLRHGRVVDASRVGAVVVVAYRLNHYAEKSRRYSADGEAGELRRAPRHEEVQAQPRRVDDALKVDVSRVSRRENARQRQREAEQVGDDDGAEDGEDVEIFILAHEAEEEDEDDDEQRDGPEVRRVELDSRRREREAYRHNRRADDDRRDYFAYAPNETSVAERRERDAADDERAADVLHDDVGPHALVRADDSPEPSFGCV